MAARQKQTQARTDDLGNLLTPEDAAAKLAVAVQTLAHWRVRGTGPTFVHLSARCVRYPNAALEQWVSDRLQLSTAENSVE